MRTKAR